MNRSFLLHQQHYYVEGRKSPLRSHDPNHQVGIPPLSSKELTKNCFTFIIIILTMVSFRSSHLCLRSFSSLLFLCCACILLQTTQVQATVYTHNSSGLVASYPSLPALFGDPFLENHLYEGRLQYIVENPFLCDDIDWNTTSFIDGSNQRRLPENDSSSNNNNSTISPKPSDGSNNDEYDLEPIVLLAMRGQCPFHTKALIAEAYSLRVEYLIIYNYNLEGEDVLVPMYSEYGSSRLKILSVTHSTGLDLKRFIKNASPRDIAQGGPIVTMDGAPPDNLLTPEEFQEALLQFIALFFMLVSFTGCFLICAATIQQQHRGSSPLWFVLLGEAPDGDAEAGDGAPSLSANRGGLLGGNRSLLTRSEVYEYLIDNPDCRGGNAETLGEAAQQGDSSSPDGASSHDSLASDSTTSSPISRTPTSLHHTHERRRRQSPPSDALDSHFTIDDDDEELGGQSSSLDEEGDYESSPNLQEPSDFHCAICIDDFDETDMEQVLKLPCGHHFHIDCIVPWLTERQSKCPLCKFDVMAFVQEAAEEQAGGGASGGLSSSPDASLPRTLWTWILSQGGRQRRTWTRIDNTASPEDMGVEMAETSRTTTAGGNSSVENGVLS